MTIVSVKILKTSENSDFITYAVGNPPAKIIANVKIFKISGEIIFYDIEDNKYKKFLLPFVLKQLKNIQSSGKYPDDKYFNS